MSLAQQSREPTQVIVDGSLLDAQTTNTNGVWQPLGRCAPLSITVRGTLGGATVTIYVSNQLASNRPLDSDNNQGVLQAFTTTGSIGSDYAFRWIKAAVTAAGGGTSVTVDVMAGK